MAWDSSLGTPQKRNKSLSKPDLTFHTCCIIQFVFLHLFSSFLPTILFFFLHNIWHFCVVGTIFLRRWDVADHAGPGGMGPMYALQQVRFAGTPIFYWTGWYNWKKQAVFSFRALFIFCWAVFMCVSYTFTIHPKTSEPIFWFQPKLVERDRVLRGIIFGQFF